MYGVVIDPNRLNDVLAEPLQIFAYVCNEFVLPKSRYSTVES